MAKNRNKNKVNNDLMNAVRDAADMSVAGVSTEEFLKTKKSAKVNNAKNTVNNGLASALDLPCGNGYVQNPLTNPATLYYNSSPVLLTLIWQPLTYAYKSNGFIQTAINQIVDDAFRNEGMIIDSGGLAYLKQLSRH